MLQTLWCLPCFSPYPSTQFGRLAWNNVDRYHYHKPVLFSPEIVAVIIFFSRIIVFTVLPEQHGTNGYNGCCMVIILYWLSWHPGIYVSINSVRPEQRWLPMAEWQVTFSYANILNDNCCLFPHLRSLHLTLELNRWHFADIFRYILLNDKCYILIQIQGKFVPESPSDDMSALMT